MRYMRQQCTIENRVSLLDTFQCLLLMHDMLMLIDDDADVCDSYRSVKKRSSDLTISFSLTIRDTRRNSWQSCPSE
jgi:hypothetical protein